MSMDLCDTDGTLYKWTNYWGGWQPRWFVLGNGILAYYDSYEESDKGCKASLNVSAGEVKVNLTDNTRFDIILQHGQHWYMKASTAAERQKWLIALGTAKARKCEFSAVKKKESGEAKGEIESKVSELRLYCDLLSNQVTNLKKEAEEQHPDVKKLTETSSMLVATCDTFLNTLTQCMKMAEHSFLSSTRPKSPTDDVPMALPPSEVHKSRRSRERHNSQRSISVDERTHHSSRTKDSAVAHHVARSISESYTVPNSPGSDMTLLPLGDAAKTLAKLNISNTPIPSNIEVQSTASPHPFTTPRVGELSKTQDSSPPKVENLGPTKQLQNNNDTKNGDSRQIVSEERRLTFFSAMLHSFTDIVIEEDGGVPSDPFLEACEDLLPFFDVIGSTAFAPVRMDLAGNIKKVRTKLLADPNRYCTLQSIVRHEIETKTTKVRNSATDALLWLKRGLRFVQVFLERIRDGEKDVTAALNHGYSSTLKVYHGWVVKGIFALAVKAAPYHSDMMKALAVESYPYESNDFTQAITQDIDDYVTALDVVLNIVDGFYGQYALDDKSVV